MALAAQQRRGGFCHRSPQAPLSGRNGSGAPWQVPTGSAKKPPEAGALNEERNWVFYRRFPLIAAAIPFTRLKHVAHSTGRPCVGLNGTVVSIPHSEQVTCISIRRRTLPLALFALHSWQCFGSCVNPLSRKKSCSPAEKIKVAPQSTHKTSRSTKLIIYSPIA